MTVVLLGRSPMSNASMATEYVHNGGALIDGLMPGSVDGDRRVRGSLVHAEHDVGAKTVVVRELRVFEGAEGRHLAAERDLRCGGG